MRHQFEERKLLLLHKKNKLKYRFQSKHALAAAQWHTPRTIIAHALTTHFLLAHGYANGKRWMAVYFERAVCAVIIPFSVAWALYITETFWCSTVVFRGTQFADHCSTPLWTSDRQIYSGEWNTPDLRHIFSACECDLILAVMQANTSNRIKWDVAPVAEFTWRFDIQLSAAD